MSKKQREKVEDEVRYHRAQMKAQQAETSPDSSVFDNQQPSSSDQLAPYASKYVDPARSPIDADSVLNARCDSRSYSSYGGDLSPYTPSGYGFTPTPHQSAGPGAGGGPGAGSGGGIGYDMSGTSDYVDSTTFDPRQTPIEPLPDSNLVSPVVSTGNNHPIGARFLASVASIASIASISPTAPGCGPSFRSSLSLCLSASPCRSFSFSFHAGNGQRRKERDERRGRASSGKHSTLLLSPNARRTTASREQDDRVRLRGRGDAVPDQEPAPGAGSRRRRRRRPRALLLLLFFFLLCHY